MILEQKSQISVEKNPRRWYSGKDSNQNDVFTCASPFNPFDGKLIHEGVLDGRLLKRFLTTENQNVCPYLSWVINVKDNRIESFRCTLSVVELKGKYDVRYFTNKQPLQVCTKKEVQGFEIFNLDFQ